MERLSEMRTPQQAVNYAVNRERGLANQQEILRSYNSNWNTVSYVRQNTRRNPPQNSQQKQTQEMMRKFLTSTPSNVPGQINNMQNMQKTKTLLITVYGKNTRTPPTTSPTKQHKSILQATTNKKSEECQSKEN